MKLLVFVSVMALALLAAPAASADPQPWCDWSPDVDVNSCGLIVGVPPTGQLVPGSGDWSTGELRTK